MRYAIQWVRSLLFNILMYVAMVPYAIVYLPWALIDRRGAVAAAHGWTGFVLWLHHQIRTQSTSCSAIKATWARHYIGRR